MIIDVHVPRDELTTRQLFRFGDAVPATYMYGNPLVPTILAQHAMCKVRGLVRTNITQPKSIALLIDDAEQCKEFCGRHQDCKLDHMASSQCSTGMFQETCGHEPINDDMKNTLAELKMPPCTSIVTCVKALEGNMKNMLQGRK